MNPILVLAPIAALFMIAVLAIGKWSNAEEKLAKFIKCYGESIVESNDYYYALLDILSDTEADWAMESDALNRHLLAHIKLTHESETAYGKLFESYEALQKSHNELQDDYRKLYRPRCPKCNRFMKDGKCNNPKCSKIDLSNLPETFDAETAGKVIEAEALKPKPLLADAKVGDLCKLKDGKWVQIVRIVENKKYPIVYMYDNTSMTTKINGQYGYWDSNYDIIHTEPLATESTAEWAKQMLLLGHKITNIDWIEDYSSYHTEYAYLDGDTVKYDNMSKGLSHSITDFLFYGTKKFGWKLYSEPKQAPDPTSEPKPILADAKVGDLCKRRDGKWVHIELIDPSKERSYMAGDSWYFPNGREYSNREYERDIVHVKQKCKDQFRDATKKVEANENKADATGNES